MRSRTPEDFQGMCSHCYLKSAHCICGALPLLETRTEVLVIRHVTERHVMSNTGRLAALVLSNCHIIDFSPELPFKDERASWDGAWLLYPGPNPIPPGPAPIRLVVLDASFRRAKRMYRRIESLHQLPQLSLSPPMLAPHRLRQPPRADGMSTIEAIAAGLALIESPFHGRVLLDAYAEFVRRADAAHGRKRPT